MAGRLQGMTAGGEVLRSGGGKTHPDLFRGNKTGFSIYAFVNMMSIHKKLLQKIVKFVGFFEYLGEKTSPH